MVDERRVKVKYRSADDINPDGLSKLHDPCKHNLVAKKIQEDH